MAYKSPRDRLQLISQQELEAALKDEAIERLIEEAIEEAGLLELLDATYSRESTPAEGRVVYDKFDAHPR